MRRKGEEGRRISHSRSWILSPISGLGTCMAEIRITSVLFVSGGENEPAIAVTRIIVPRPTTCMGHTGDVTFHHHVERVDWVRWAAMHIVPPSPPIINPAPRIREQVGGESAVERVSGGSGLMIQGEVARLQTLPHPIVVTPSLVSGRVRATLSMIAATIVSCHALRIVVALIDVCPSLPVVILRLETA